MLKPLKQFYCDTCGEIIEKPEEGWLEWIQSYDKEKKKNEIHSFNIVHHYGHSPLAKNDNYGCYQHHLKPGRSDNHLHYILDENYKMGWLLSFLDVGPHLREDFRGLEITDLRQYIETVRRLTIPYYEEARMYWDKANEDGFFEGANEIWIYGVKNLKKIVEKYAENKE